jgi:hypothetical protein
LANFEDRPCVSRFSDQTQYWHEAGLESVQRSLEAVEDGALVLNFELIDLARRNTNAAFSLINRVASAKTPAEIFALQVAHSWTQFDRLLWQAEELSALATRVLTDIAQAGGVGRALGTAQAPRLESQDVTRGRQG